MKFPMTVKYLAVIVVLVGLTIYVSFQDEHHAKHVTSPSASSQTPAALAQNDANRGEGGTDGTQWNSPGWYGFFRWPSGTTVWAIILTLLAIVEQTIETRKAAEATESMVALTRDTNTQWVELEPYGVLAKTEAGQPDPPTIVTIQPRWKIINNTSLPLTLKTVEVKIAVGGGWQTYVFEFHELISPGSSGNYRTFFAPFPLNTAETSEFLGAGIELSIAIKADFVGVSGKNVEQYFGDFYFCKVGLLEINHPIGKGPQRQYLEKDDSPSTLVEEKGIRYLDADGDAANKPN